LNGSILREEVYGAPIAEGAESQIDNPIDRPFVLQRFRKNTADRFDELPILVFSCFRFWFHGPRYRKMDWIRLWRSLSELIFESNQRSYVHHRGHMMWISSGPVLSLPVVMMTLMTVTVSVLGSGSRGNSTFIRTDQVRLLIDAGINRKDLARRLESIGEDPDGIDAVLITHEHTDHSSALRVLLNELPARAFLTNGTLAALQTDQDELDRSAVVQITAGVPFTIGDAEIMPFSVPHDAAEPVAFAVTVGNIKISQLTDIGCLPESVADQLRGSDVLILESNHDLDMLRIGPYPWNLKQRLMSRRGHLSNMAVARFIREQYDGHAQRLVLAHLSSQNNHPEIARQEAARAMRSRGFDSERLVITNQDVPSPPLWL
jgi:phosphoribosyl 1,2-cyclic phosphodiesterase